MPKFSSVNCCLIYFLLIGLHISHQQTDAPEHCKGAQQWPLNGRALVRDYKGRVLLLTFVSLKQCDSDCEHALKKLDSLHDQFPSARILAIAPADEPAADVRTFAWKFPHIRFEHEHKKSAIWQWFRSGHLDQFIFDRCSRHSIRLPPSASGFPPAFALTAQAIRKTITQQPCGPCEYDWDKAAPKWTSLHPPVLKKVNVMGDLLAAFSTEIGSPKDGFMHAQKQLAFAEQHQHAGVGIYHRQRQNSHPQQQTQPGGNHQQQQQFNQEQLQLQRQREELARLQQQQVERERLLREHEERLRQRHQMEEQQRRHWAEQQQRHQQQQQQQPYGHTNIVADATASPPVSHNQQHISVQQPATRQQQQQQLQQPSLHNQQPTSAVRYAKDPFGDRYGFGLGRPRNQQQQQNERRKPSSAIAAEQQPQTRTRTKAIPQSAYDQQLQIPEAPVRTEEAVAPLYPEGSETADYYGYEDEWTTEMPSLMQIPKPTKPAVPTTPTLQQQDKNFGFELPCSGFSDENCFQQQTQLRPNEIHRCCRGRILFSDQCIQGKCSNMTTQLCCIQRFLQAKLTCCSDERQAETGVGDHFSRCCFDNFVDGEDPCCPREYAAEQWRTVHELCLPNVEMDLTGVKVPVPLLGTSLITEFDFGKTDKWRFECRYGGHVEQYSFFEQSASEEHGNEEGREIGDD